MSKISASAHSSIRDTGRTGPVERTERLRESEMSKDKYYGKSLRKNFARHEEVMPMPNLLEIQKKSYKWFWEEGDVYKRQVLTRCWASFPS